MTEILTAGIDQESRAYRLMRSNLGDHGMALLDEQLKVWRELNETELESPLRDSFKSGLSELPTGTLMHGLSFNEEALRGIAELGIVSGELLGVPEDAETHGCADFYKVPKGTTIAEYFDYIREPVQRGGATTPKSEIGLAKGIAIIVDPNATGMERLAQHDAYTDREMAEFTHPLSYRTKENTAAILGGVPKGSIAGVVLPDKFRPSGPRVPDRTNIDKVCAIFPGVPVFDERGQRLDSLETHEKSPAEQLDGNVADILVKLDVLSMAQSGGDKPRFDRAGEKTDTNYNDNWRSVSAERVLTFEDGSWIDMSGMRTDTDGVYDPDAADAAYQLTFVRNAGPAIEPHPVEAFSVEMYKDKEHGDPTLIVWDIADEGAADYFSGDRILERPELKTLESVHENLDGESDGLLRLHLG